MNQEFAPYQDIIEQLKPVINEPDFNQLLSTTAHKLSKPKRFLLKMELKRLAKPCQRQIDLRGLVDGRCTPYEFEGITHYLDDIAIEVFERQTRAFGSYTLGVFEAVTNTDNNYRVMQQREKQQEQAETKPRRQDDTYPVTPIAFAALLHRQEERMNFTVAAILYNQQDEGVNVTTLDLSVQGLKVKIKRKAYLREGDKVVIQFLGLPTEHLIDKREGIPYEVVQIQNTNDELTVSLKRSHTRKNPNFDAFLERFIHGNKRRYKVNMDNTVNAILAKGYEQYYIPHMTSLPLFIKREKEQLSVQYVLTNDSNKDTLYYWLDNEHRLQLDHLLNHDRLSAILSLADKSTYLFCFTHQRNENSFFYSASREELIKQGKKQAIYLGFGARKASWRVFKVQLSDMHPEQCHLPSSLPNEIALQERQRNAKPPAPRLMGKLQQLHHAVLLTDVTNEFDISPYCRFKINREQLVHLKTFLHPVAAQKSDISLHRFKYQNMRTQHRYQLRTQLILDTGDFELNGHTEDISELGIKAELNQPFLGDLYDEVKISFPQLQKVSKKYPLVDLHYEVRNISTDKFVLNLHVVHHDEERVAEEFFEKLIRNNKDKLKAFSDEEGVPGMGEALRNIYSANVENVAFYLAKQSGLFHPDAILKLSPSHSLYRLFTHGQSKGSYHLHVLYGQGRDKYIQSTLKELKNNAKPIQLELLVAYKPEEQSIKRAIDARFSDQFETDRARRDFAMEAMNSGEFFALKVFLMRTGRPDTEMIRTEMNYVGIYALHKAKALEDKLWNITGVGDVIDATDLALHRYGFSHEQVLKNRQAGQETPPPPDSQE